jgi:uncharacterized phage protein (TIGR01671 family)
MREIKLRAWDKIDKRMIINEQEFIPLKITNKGVLRLNAQHEESFWEIMPLERFEFTEFTGLRDKSGKEIYEGDVCKCPVTINKNIWGEFSNREVKWKEDSFTWVLDGEWAWIDFETAFGDEGDYIIWNDESKIINIEVIGNLFENPELISK